MLITTIVTNQESNKEISLLLNSIADNLLMVIPSHVKDDDIYGLENFLNDLYIQAFNENWKPDLQETLLEMLGRAGELSSRVMHLSSDVSRNREFYKTLKSLAPMLKMVAVFLDE